MGTPDPSSAISSVYSEAGVGGQSMERENSMGGLSIDFDKLSLEKGRPLDVEDLDDEGWAAASDQKMITALGDLGEGAGGAVTRCMLEGGKTVFALKVSYFLLVRRAGSDVIRLSRQVPTPTSRSKFCENSNLTRIACPTISASTMVRSWTSLQVQYPLQWSFVKEVVWTVSIEK
jgi:hypothetical protein